MNYKLLAAISNSVWAMHPESIQGYYPFVMNALKGMPVQFENLETSKMFQVLSAGSMKAQSVSSFNESPKQSVAVINIHDVIVKNDEWCGPVGTNTISQMILEADANPNIAGIILDIDSPGGEASAIPLIAQTIKNAQKPIIAYVGNGMAASAGYAIAAECDEIYATFNTDIIGSIGTYLTIADWYKYYQSQGLEMTDIYASLSTEKNKGYRDALNGDNTAIQAKVDYWNENFISIVKSGRAGKLNEAALKGQAYFADQALTLGLIDGMKSFNECVSRIHELSVDSNATETPHS